MGSPCRQENHLGYARMHFDLDSHDSHDSHATTDDDRPVWSPNPAQKKATKN